MRHGDAAVEARRHRLLALEHAGDGGLGIGHVAGALLRHRADHLLAGVALVRRLELRQHHEAAQVARDALVAALDGLRRGQHLLHVLLADGLGDRPREVVHLRGDLHPRGHHDRLLGGRAVEADLLAVAADGQLNVVHRDLPDVVRVRQARREEALVAELQKELDEHHFGDVLVRQLEHHLARAVRAALRVAHALRLRREERDERGRRDERRDERHHDADAEDLLRQVPGREADSRDDQGHLAARHHARADPQAAEHVEAAAERGHHAAEDLRGDGERGVDRAEDENRLRAERADVDHHAHRAEEDRHEEGVDGREHLLDRMLEVGAREREAHHVRADDHREPHHLEEAREDERETERHRRDHDGRLEEEFQKPRQVPRREHADQRRAQPHAERLGRDEPDLAPVHALAAAPARARGDDDAVADGEHDEAEHVVDDGAGHDRRALLRIHLLLLGEDARGDADRRGGGHDAHVERRLLRDRLRERQVLQVREGVEEPRQQVDGAEVAEEERDDHAADADERADERVLEEHAEVRLETRQEEEDDRGERRDAVERGRGRVEHGVVAGDRAEHRGHGALRRGVQLAQRRAVEEAVLEEAPERIGQDRDAAERPRADDDAGRELAEDRRQLQERRERAAHLRGEDDDADLQHEEHHVLGARQAEVRIGGRGLVGERGGGGERGQDGQRQFLDFHLLTICPS